MMVALYQLFFSFPLLVPSALASQVALGDIGTNLANGAKCLAGINSLPSDDCSSAAVYTSGYILANLGYNILIILLLKYGGSNILWLAMTTNVPVSALTFAVPGIPGFTPLSWTVGLGLPVIMAGLCIYRFYEGAKAWVDKLMGREEAGKGGGDVELQ